MGKDNRKLFKILKKVMDKNQIVELINPHTCHNKNQKHDENRRNLVKPFVSWVLHLGNNIKLPYFMKNIYLLKTSTICYLEYFELYRFSISIDVWHIA